MMNGYTYTDYVYMSEVLQCISKFKDTYEKREDLTQKILLHAEKINRANKTWKLPRQRLRCIIACQAIADMLKIGMSIEAIRTWLEKELEEQINNPPKCKVLFLAEEISVWPSLESISKAMKKDARYEAQVVFLPFVHKDKKFEHEIEYQKYIQQGVQLFRHERYDLSKEAPDVVFYLKPYDGAIPAEFASTEVGCIVDRIVYVPYGMELTKSLIKYGYQHPLHYKAWRHVAYGDIVHQIGKVHGFRAGQNIAVWGHPKADQYRKERVYEVPEEWKEKIAGRRVLLWCPHHTVKPGRDKVSTWVEFSQSVFRTVERHPEIVLLMRPHLLMFGALVNNGFMTQEELDAFISEKTVCDNIILDQTEDYRVATYISDGLITDGTTFAIEYLYSGKPYMVTTLDTENFYLPEAMEEALYIGQSEKEIEAFIEMFACSEDPKEEKRMAFKKDVFFLPESQTVGEYIADQVYDELTREEQERARRMMSDE